MKISNEQMRIVLPLCLREAKENPNACLDAYIDNLIALCVARNLRDLLDGLDRGPRTAVRLETRGTHSNIEGLWGKAKGTKKDPVPQEPVHPLFRDSAA